MKKDPILPHLYSHFVENAFERSSTQLDTKDSFPMYTFLPKKKTPYYLVRYPPNFKRKEIKTYRILTREEFCIILLHNLNLRRWNRHH
jgi:hypothetical protein